MENTRDGQHSPTSSFNMSRHTSDTRHDGAHTAHPALPTSRHNNRSPRASRETDSGNDWEHELSEPSGLARQQRTLRNEAFPHRSRAPTTEEGNGRSDSEFGSTSIIFGEGQPPIPQTASATETWSGWEHQRGGSHGSHHIAFTHDGTGEICFSTAYEDASTEHQHALDERVRKEDAAYRRQHKQEVEAHQARMKSGTLARDRQEPSNELEGRRTAWEEALSYPWYASASHPEWKPTEANLRERRDLETTRGCMTEFLRENRSTGPEIRDGLAELGKEIPTAFPFQKMQTASMGAFYKHSSSHGGPIGSGMTSAGRAPTKASRVWRDRASQGERR